jgi:hypothetical protein
MARRRALPTSLILRNPRVSRPFFLAPPPRGENILECALSLGVPRACCSTRILESRLWALETNGATVETWSFSWYEDLFAQDAGTKSVVNVASKVYRRIALYEPGEYTVTLNYQDGEQTEAKWLVRPLAEEKRAKNVIFFIGEGPSCEKLDNS